MTFAIKIFFILVLFSGHAFAIPCDIILSGKYGNEDTQAELEANLRTSNIMSKYKAGTMIAAIRTANRTIDKTRQSLTFDTDDKLKVQEINNDIGFLLSRVDQLKAEASSHRPMIAEIVTTALRFDAAEAVEVLMNEHSASESNGANWPAIAVLNPNSRMIELVITHMNRSLFDRFEDVVNLEIESIHGASRTLLQLAAEANPNPEVVQILLANGADIGITTGFKHETALDLSKKNKNPQVGEVLRKFNQPL